MVGGPQVVVDQQLEEGEGQVGLGVGGDLPYLLQKFLDGVVRLRNFVVFAVENRHIEAEVVELAHLLTIHYSTSYQ